MQTFAVIPAAGESRRMGEVGPKLLLPWQGKALFEHVLDHWLQSDVDYVVAVVNPHLRELAEFCRRRGVEFVEPHEVPPDMKASVLLGLERIERGFSPAPRDAWLLAPADMPLLSPPAINAVICAAQEAAGEDSLLAPSYEGRYGHPVLLRWAHVAAARCLGPDQGINSLTSKLPLREVPVDDPGILADLDTPEDFRRLQNRNDRSNRDG